MPNYLVHNIGLHSTNPKIRFLEQVVFFEFTYNTFAFFFVIVPKVFDRFTILNSIFLIRKTDF